MGDALWAWVQYTKSTNGLSKGHMLPLIGLLMRRDRYIPTYVT